VLSREIWLKPHCSVDKCNGRNKPAPFLLRIHGINERISKKNYEDIVGFYFTLIQNCDVKELPETHSGVHEF
jgi:hypothetical protein